MSGVKISALPSASAASTFDQLEVNQSGTTRRITVGQVAAHISPTGPDILRLFGAVGDGITDDTVAFQAAVNAMANNILYVFPGSYLISSVNLPATITIAGAGDGSVLKTVSDAPMLGYEAAAPGGNGIHIRGLKFLGNSAAMQLQVGVSLRGAINISVIDCTFTDIAARCISVTYSHTWSVVSKHIQITGNRIVNVGDVGIFLKTAVENCIVTGNTLDVLGVTGANPGFCVGIVVDDKSGSQLPIAAKNVIVANNVIQNLQGDDTSSGMIISGGLNVVVADNILTDIGVIGGPPGCTGIRVSNGGGTPNVQSTRVLVTGNILTNIGNHGISLLQGQQCSVIGNQITNWGCNNPGSNQMSAVAIEDASLNCVVTGNVMSAGPTSDYGVLVSGASSLNNRVWGNIIDANGVAIEEVHDIATGTIRMINPGGQVSASGPGTTLLMHGATGSGNLSTTATEFLVCQGIAAPNATEQVMRVAFVDRDIYVRRWRVVLGTAPGVGNSRTFTLRRAGVDTAATVTISDATTTATFTGTGYLLIAAGNWITIRTTLTGTPVASAVSFVMEYSV